MDSDRDLLDAWRAGDRDAGSQLVDRHYACIHRFFANKAGRAEDVEELVQTTFVNASEGVVRFRGEASIRTWLFAIARNVLLQWFERRGRALRREVELGTTSVADLGIGPSTFVGKRREQRLLLEALRNIPLESQVVLELKYWEQLSAREVGQILDYPEGTVRSRLRKAKLELRAVVDRLARTRPELESTVENLDDWARQVRASWL